MAGEVKYEKLQVPYGPSCSGGYLQDIESGESFTMLEHDWIKGLQSLGSRSHFEADRNCCIGIPTKSESLVLGSQPQNRHADRLNCSVSNELFDCTADGVLSIEEQWFKYPISFSSKNIDQFEDVSSIFSENNAKDKISIPVLSSGGTVCPSIPKQESDCNLVGENVNEGSHVGMDIFIRTTSQKSDIGTHVKRRLRKPPQRFIDELPDPNSRTLRRRSNQSSTEVKEKMPRIELHKSVVVKSRSEWSLPEKSLGKPIQVPFGPLLCSESRKRKVPIVSKPKTESKCHLVSSPDFKNNQVAASQKLRINQMVGPSCPKVMHSLKRALVTPSQENGVGHLKSGDKDVRRKHHILWSMTEVRRLIDGVSQHGVGRWSLIKKDLFASSSHRTAVDLKDKWRNLLKAAYLQRENKKREMGKRNMPWRPLPKSILRRVTELSITYPYPRGFQSKH